MQTIANRLKTILTDWIRLTQPSRFRKVSFHHQRPFLKTGAFPELQRPPDLTQRYKLEQLIPPFNLDAFAKKVEDLHEAKRRINQAPTRLIEGNLHLFVSLAKNYLSSLLPLMMSFKKEMWGSRERSKNLIDGMASDFVPTPPDGSGKPCSAPS